MYWVGWVLGSNQDMGVCCVGVGQQSRHRCALGGCWAAIKTRMLFQHNRDAIILVLRNCLAAMHAISVLDDCSATMHAALVLDDCSAAVYAALVPDDCSAATHAIVMQFVWS